MLPVIQQARQHSSSVAVRELSRQYTYEEVLRQATKLSGFLLNGAADLKGARICTMLPPGFSYVSSLWAIWQAGAVAVPLCLTYPLAALAYHLEDAGAEVLLIARAYESLLKEHAEQNGIRLLIWEELEAKTDDSRVALPEIELSRPALILYTSGTTNKPKGVVTTHANIYSQITTLVEAWKWSSEDRTVCVLPLHHVHGIINVVCCSLWVGASCLFLPEFSPTALFQRFVARELNVFMAVPTVYYKLIAHFDSLPVEEQAALKKVMSEFRLMVCGSAALPVSIMEKWKSVSGQVLLERYGMTELGMAISNPYDGERKAGYVGWPLPGVEVKLVDEAGQSITNDQPGEILVKGPNVFKEYWNRAEATKESFTEDGWFKTGDMAVVENGYYRILGRSSVDIIKSGGYKISALEIEETLREASGIKDCAVVGIPNEEWGELIVAAIVKVHADVDFSAAQTEAYLLQKMAAYKKPRKYLVVDELPRNAMGKVVKNEVKKLFTENN